MQSQTRPKRAIVIGGSIAGLLSAKVLSDTFDEVVIIERDRIPEDAAERVGVPQSPQPHILLTQGYRLLQEFFPGIQTDLQQAGAVPVDWGQDFQYFVFNNWCATTSDPTDLNSFSCTRPLLESTIRKRVEQINCIDRLSPYRVEGLTGSNNRVTGVRCRRSDDKSDKQIVEADLVIDASGRSTNAPKWLSALGAVPPEIEKVDAQLGYATGRYRIPADWHENWKVLLIAHQPPDMTQLGYLARVEDNELIATLGGYCQEYPPLTQTKFVEAAKKLPDRTFYEAIAQSTPVSKIKAYRATANRRCRYERLETIPKGFIAIGDSVCALCPAYGQGLTTSAMSAMVLRKWLSNNQNKAQKRIQDYEIKDFLSFQKSLAKQIKPAWDAATNNDSGFLKEMASAKGLRTHPQNLIGRLLGAYMHKLIVKTHTDSELTVALTRITHMIDSPAKLMHPKMILKVLT